MYQSVHIELFTYSLNLTILHLCSAHRQTGLSFLFFPNNLSWVWGVEALPPVSVRLWSTFAKISFC